MNWAQKAARVALRAVDEMESRGSLRPSLRSPGSRGAGVPAHAPRGRDARNRPAKRACSRTAGTAPDRPEQVSAGLSAESLARDARRRCGRAETLACASWRARGNHRTARRQVARVAERQSRRPLLRQCDGERMLCEDARCGIARITPVGPARDSCGPHRLLDLRGAIVAQAARYASTPTPTSSSRTLR